MQLINFLRNLASQLREFLGFISTDGNDVENNSPDDYLKFLELLLDKEFENFGGDARHIYAVLEANLDKLNLNFIPVLQGRLGKINDSKVPKLYADLIENIAIKIIEFPRGSRADNIEIAIAAYKIVLSVHTFESNPEKWAIMQNRLGAAYTDRIRGDRAENIESAIAYFTDALKVRTREAFPQQWAMTQSNLGNAYLYRIEGERADNLEKAIELCTATLEILTPKALPNLWAMTQNNLGTAYLYRIREEKAQNIEDSIAYFTAALNVYTNQAFPEDWAMIQMNLGNAYYSKVRGVRAENIEKAIKCYTDSLFVRTRKDFPQDWAITQNNLGLAYSNRIKGEKADNIEKAIEYHTETLTVYKREDFPEKWAMTQYNLGLAYSNRIKGEKADNIEKAIEYYTAALTFYTREAFLEQRAMTQNNLGLTYLYRIRKEKAENIEKAIEFLTAALTFYISKANNLSSSKECVVAHNTLGALYNERIEGKKTDNIQKAIEYLQSGLLLVKNNFNLLENAVDLKSNLNINLATAYIRCFDENRADNIEKGIAILKNVLEELTLSTNSSEIRAMTQLNLGVAYLERIHGDLSENQQDAIACSLKALTFFKKETFPEDWAKIQQNLGTAYCRLIQGKISDNIEKAIIFFNKALEIYNFHKFPWDWATVQHNLGATYRRRIKGKKIDNLKLAIDAYNNALKIRKSSPQQWAATQMNLAVAYCERGYRNSVNDLKEGIKAYNEALKVFSYEDYPYQWGMIKNNLGATYTDIYMLDKEFKNLDKAIECCKEALKIRTHQKYTTNHAETLFNLGRAYKQGYKETKNKKLIESAYITFFDCIESVELIRYDNYSREESRQQLAEDWNKLYQAMVEVCLEMKKDNQAIEFVERSKTRNLVELITTRDLYPKGNIPQSILNELDRLRREITAEQRRLNNEQTIQNSYESTISRERSQIPKEVQFSILDRSHLNQLQQQLDELIARNIAPIDPNFSFVQKVEPIPYNEIQSLTGEKTAILEWYVIDDTDYKFLTFIITPQSPTPIIWQSSTADLEKLKRWATRYLQAYLNNKHHWKRRLTVRLRLLAKILHLDEILKSIPKQCDRLILIPHRFLHLFPLHALPVSQETWSQFNPNTDFSPANPYLLDCFVGGVGYAPSCQLLQQAQMRQRPNFSHLFAIQNPTNDLQYTDLEVQAIAQHFDPSDILANATAKIEALDEQRLRNAHCAHFSCHGYFNFANPLQSALLLADCRISPAPPEADPNRYLLTEDGSAIDLSKCLTLDNIFTRDFSACRLVVLSACETGLTDFSSLSDEYIGLPSGFLVAGSPSVVSSLWAVNDLSTALLMMKFYQNLKAGLTVTLALNTAQTWLRNATKEELINQLDLNAAQRMQLRVELKNIDANTKPFESPDHWAAFCAIGQ